MSYKKYDRSSEKSISETLKNNIVEKLHCNSSISG